MATTNTAMERVTRMPEILDIIFSHGPLSQDARCIQVNRLWSDIALNHLWREGPPLRALFELLAPLVPSDHMSQTETPTLKIFSRPVMAEDWIRFFRISRRIREFRIRSHEMELMADSVFTELSMTCPAVSIFPHIETLNVWSSLTVPRAHYLCIFLCRSIKSLYISMWNPDTAEEARSLLNLILQRSPGITSFNLSNTMSSVKGIKKDFCLFFSGLRQLESLYLPPSLLSADVLNSIAPLPNLTYLDISSLDLSEEGEDVHINFSLPDSESAFRSLTGLEMWGDFKTVTKFFSPRVFPLKLQTLSILSVEENQASDFRSCLEALANACPELKDLKFPMCSIVHNPPISGQMTAQDLSPLTSFPLLEIFELRHDRAVSMSDEELVCIIKGCPSLRHLDLNCVPLSVATESTSLTLGFLALLAKESAAVKLEYLAIYVNALTTDGLPEVEGYLENLRYISFGVSPVCKLSDEVLLYLSQLIPATCKLDMGLDHRLDNLWGDKDEKLDRRYTWEGIGSMLPIVTRARLDERKRKNKPD